MQTYWERRRNNQEENNSSRDELEADENSRTSAKSGRRRNEDKESDVNGRGRNSFSSVGSIPTTSDSLNERPTKKNSQKENKKHPYKKVRK